MHLIGDDTTAVTEAARIAGEMAVALLDAARPGARAAAPYQAAMTAAHLRQARAEVRVERYRSAGGVVLLAQLTCWYGGHEVRRALTVPVGSPTPGLESALQTAEERYLAGLRALRPGATLGQVRAAMDPGADVTARVSLLNHRMSGDVRVVPGMTVALEVACDLDGNPALRGGTALTTAHAPIDLNRQNSPTDLNRQDSR
ncbi:hypothetical protein [Nonomuraea typhae]|uniref:Uncharacterized protein n=1 Tax=Nonomuraea typhae TaxID=2603600 RepID=A0ABW7YYT8_9ACTN